MHKNTEEESKMKIIEENDSENLEFDKESAHSITRIKEKFIKKRNAVPEKSENDSLDFNYNVPNKSNKNIEEESINENKQLLRLETMLSQKTKKKKRLTIQPIKINEFQKDLGIEFSRNSSSELQQLRDARFSEKNLYQIRKGKEGRIDRNIFNKNKNRLIINKAYEKEVENNIDPSPINKIKLLNSNNINNESRFVNEELQRDLCRLNENFYLLANSEVLNNHKNYNSFDYELKLNSKDNSPEKHSSDWNSSLTDSSHNLYDGGESSSFSSQTSNKKNNFLK